MYRPDIHIRTPINGNYEHYTVRAAKSVKHHLISSSISFFHHPTFGGFTQNRENTTKNARKLGGTYENGKK